MKKGRLTAILWRNALVIAGLLSYMAATKNVYAAIDGVPKVKTSGATDIGTNSATLNGDVDINIQEEPKGYVMFFYGDKNEGYTGVSEIVSINPKPKIGFWDERLAK